MEVGQSVAASLLLGLCSVCMPLVSREMCDELVTPKI